MKKENAPHKKKHIHYSNTEETTQNVSEPDTAYAMPYQTTTTRTINLMGMSSKREFTSIHNENDFINIIRTGIPKQAMTHLMDITEISLNEMAAIIHTSDRTLRRYSPQQKLSQEQSERTIEVARLYSRGTEVLGNIELFKNWMDATLLPLGNKKPKEFLDTSFGINMLMDELGRIEHGILA